MGDFFWNSSRRDKKGDSIFFSSSVGRTCQGWSIYPWPFQTLTLQNINSLTAAATFSYSYMSWLIIIWSTFFISFLLLFSSTTSSGFCPIFTINNMEKWAYLWEEWPSGLRCCDWNRKVPSSNPTRHLARLRDLTSLQGSQWPLGRICKTQVFFKVEWGEAKGKEHDFWLNLVERKTLEETMISFYISRYHFSQISRTSFRIIRKKFLSKMLTFLMDSLKPIPLL